MNGADYIDFAGKIAVTYTDAASCRSAISRAYYGAFHVVKGLLEQLGIRPPRNANAHVFAQRRLANCGYDPAVEVGLMLIDLYADRLNADYDLHKMQVENVAYARTAVETARRIQEIIESFDGDYACESIKRGIAEYERKLGGK